MTEKRDEPKTEKWPIRQINNLKVGKETPNDEKKYTTNDQQKNGIMDEK